MTDLCQLASMGLDFLGLVPCVYITLVAWLDLLEMGC